MYGLAAIMLITHVEHVDMPEGKVPIFFLYKEDKGSHFWLKHKHTQTDWEISFEFN